MKISSATFLTSAVRRDGYPRDRRPEFAFLGRSNVGKSSLMNTLMGKRGLAKTSATPGKTQLINFFDLNGKFYLVDLPGYGYAKVPKSVKKKWGDMITEYLVARKELKLVVLLLDARHEPSRGDHEMLEMLDRAEVPTLLVATKMDKLKQSERTKNLKRMRTALALSEDALVVPFSAVSKEGKDDLWGVIEDILADPA